MRDYTINSTGYRYEGGSKHEGVKGRGRMLGVKLFR
jgi:hypothetical protein